MEIKSQKCLNKGYEKIKKQVEGQKDKALLKVVDYLLSREDMYDKYANEEKNLKDMCNFIQLEARKNSQSGWNCFDDDEVYSWAIHYFDESNEKLNIKVKKEIIKKEEKEVKASPKVKNVSNKNLDAYEQLTLF